MFLRVTTSSAALALMMAPAAFSLTADEVWQAWEDSLTVNGYEVAVGERDAAGDALTLRDVVLSMANQPDVLVEVTIPRIEMAPTGGDDIRVEFPDEIGFSITDSSGDDEDEVTGASGVVDASKLETIASEADGKQRWVTSGSEAKAEINRLTLEDAVFDGDVATITVTDVKSDSLFAGPGKVEQDFSAGGISFNLAMADDEANLRLDGQIDGLEMTGGYDYPEGQKAGDSTAISEALAAGGKTNAEGKFGPLDITFDFQAEDPDDGPTSIAGKVTSQAASFGVDMAKEGMRYQGDMQDIAYEFNGDEVPFPINVTLDASRFDVLLPLLSGAEAQPFNFRYALENLTLGEEIWGMIDDGGNFPHDPATIDIDVEGNVILEEDLLPLFDQLSTDPDAMDEPPFKLSDLTINKLALRAVGVAVDSDGAVRFPDPDDMEIADGELNATYSGVNALLDNLVAAGLIPEDQVTGMRMGMMMFARPVEGEDDTMSTTLEFKEDGSIFANGMQIQ